MGKKLRERKGITLCSVRSLSPVQGPRPRSSQSMRGRFIRPKGHRTVSDFPNSSRFPRCLCHRSWCSSACLPEWRQPGWARAASKGLHLHSAQAVPGRREMPPQACFLSLNLSPSPTIFPILINDNCKCPVTLAKNLLLHLLPLSLSLPPFMSHPLAKPVGFIFRIESKHFTKLTWIIANSLLNDLFLPQTPIHPPMVILFKK